MLAFLQQVDDNERLEEYIAQNRRGGVENNDHRSSSWGRKFITRGGDADEKFYLRGSQQHLPHQRRRHASSDVITVSREQQPGTSSLRSSREQLATTAQRKDASYYPSVSTPSGKQSHNSPYLQLSGGGSTSARSVKSSGSLPVMSGDMMMNNSGRKAAGKLPKKPTTRPPTGVSTAAVASKKTFRNRFSPSFDDYKNASLFGGKKVYQASSEDSEMCCNTNDEAYTTTSPNLEHNPGVNNVVYLEGEKPLLYSDEDVEQLLCMQAEHMHGVLLAKVSRQTQRLNQNRTVAKFFALWKSVHIDEFRRQMLVVNSSLSDWNKYLSGENTDLKKEVFGLKDRQTDPGRGEFKVIPGTNE